MVYNQPYTRMLERVKLKLYALLRRTEPYTKTDMVYLVSGSFWLNVNKVLSNASGIVLTLAFANFVSPQTFGTYKYAVSALGFITAFTLSGVGTALTRSPAQGKTGFMRDVLRTCLRVSTLGCALAAATSVYYFYQGNVTIGTSFLLIAVGIPLLGSFGAITKGVFDGKKDFKGSAYFNIPRNLFVTVAMVAVLLATNQALIIISAYFIIHTSTAVLGYVYATRRNHIDTKQKDPETSSETVRYAKHMSVLGFFSIAANEIDKLLLWHFAGPVQLATYTFALAPVREIRNALENVFTLAMPKFAAHSLPTLRSSMAPKLFKMLVFNIPIVIIYILAAPSFFQVFFPQYTDAVFYSQLLVLLLLLQPKGFIRTSFVAHAKIKEQYSLMVSDSVIRILAYVLFIPIYGIWGIIIAHFIAEALTFALLGILLKRVTTKA